MNRRGFLTAILAAGVAPAIVKASRLMPVRSMLTVEAEESLILPAFTCNERYTAGWTDARGVFGYGSRLWPGIQEYWGKEYAKFGP